MISELSATPTSHHTDNTPSAIGLVTFADGAPPATTLGLCHPHGGAWSEWTAT